MFPHIGAKLSEHKNTLIVVGACFSIVMSFILQARDITRENMKMKELLNEHNLTQQLGVDDNGWEAPSLTLILILGSFGFMVFSFM